MVERPNSDTSIDLSGCIIDWIMNLIRIGGVILLVVLEMLDFVKTATSGNKKK